MQYIHQTDRDCLEYRNIAKIEKEDLESQLLDTS